MVFARVARVLPHCDSPLLAPRHRGGFCTKPEGHLAIKRGLRPVPWPISQTTFAMVRPGFPRGNIRQHHRAIEHSKQRQLPVPASTRNRTRRSRTQRSHTRVGCGQGLPLNNLAVEWVANKISHSRRLPARSPCRRYLPRRSRTRVGCHQGLALQGLAVE